MTDSTDENPSTEQSSTRRIVLKGIAGVGIGAALGVGGVYTIADQSDYVNTKAITGPAKPDKSPAETPPDDTSSPRTTPWNEDTIVFSIDRADNIRGLDHIPVELGNAAEFWNDYIEANEQFDLTLSFEPNHADPDILLTEHSIMECFGEYDSPATDDQNLSPLVCVETLTETPTETPVTAQMSVAGGAKAMYRLVAQHTLGRLIGYDIWTGPQDVMTPKILFGPSHAAHPDAPSILATPSRGAGDRADIAEKEARNAEELRNVGANDVKALLETISDGLEFFLDQHEDAMNSWQTRTEELGFPRYVDAYEETVLTDDIAYLTETRSFIDELHSLENGEDIVASDKLDTVIEHLETIGNWMETREEFDVQIHRRYTDRVWSEWPTV